VFGLSEVLGRECREYQLQSALGGHQMIASNIAATHAIFVTNAPAEYDYPYMEVINGDYSQRVGQTWRLVALQVDRAAYQLGRYGSGLFACLPRAEFDDED
jgi:hypothetical protein